VLECAAINQLVIDHEGGNEFYVQFSTLLVICEGFDCWRIDNLMGVYSARLAPSFYSSPYLESISRHSDNNGDP
jgi:hypothetical protein